MPVSKGTGPFSCGMAARAAVVSVPVVPSIDPYVLLNFTSRRRDVLTLAQSGPAGALVGRVAWQALDRWNFRVIGPGAEDPGLTFAAER